MHAKQKVLESSMHTLRNDVEAANREKDKEVKFSRELSGVLKQLQEKVGIGTDLCRNLDITH